VKYHAKTPKTLGENCFLVPNVAGKFIYSTN